jgi:hypothetical protein
MPLSPGSLPDHSQSYSHTEEAVQELILRWTFGSDKGQVAGELELLHDFLTAIQADTVQGDHSTTSLTDRPPAFLIRGKFKLSSFVLTSSDLQATLP